MSTQERAWIKLAMQETLERRLARLESLRRVAKEKGQKSTQELVEAIESTPEYFVG